MFEIGQRVRSTRDGKTFTVMHANVVAVQNDEGECRFGLPIDFSIAPPRAFECGDFVRVIADGGIGFVFEDDGDDEDCSPYVVALDTGEEEVFSADELIPWIPEVGDYVYEKSDQDDDALGLVVYVNSDVGCATVQWDGFPQAQTGWAFASLEPDIGDDDAVVDSFLSDLADDGGPYNEIQVGDRVQWESPFLAKTYNATVTDRNGNMLYVDFDNGALVSGGYSVDSFTKLAA